MLSSEARIGTERAARYLAQLCRHTQQVTRLVGHGRRSHADGEKPPRIRRVEWSQERGVIELESGRCTLTAVEGALTLHVEAADEDALRRIRTLIGRRLETIGRRDGLVVSWTATSPDRDAHPLPAPAALDAPLRHGRRALPITAAAVVGLLLAGHLAVGDALASVSWTGWTVAVVVAVLLVKVALIAVGHSRFRARRPGTRGSAGGEHT